MPEDSNQKDNFSTLPDENAGAEQAQKTPNPFDPQTGKNVGEPVPAPNEIGSPPTPLLPEEENEENDAPDGKKGWWPNFLNTVRTERKLVLSTAGIFLVIVLTLIGLYFFLFASRANVATPPFSLEFNEPERIVAGQVFDFEVRLTNEGERELQGLTLFFNLPNRYTWRESSLPSESSDGTFYRLGSLSAGQTIVLTLTGVLDGQSGDRRPFSAEARFRQSGVNREFLVTSRTDYELTSPDLILNLTGPAEAVRGQSLAYGISYQNVSDRVLRGVTVRLSTPNDFSFSDSSPALDGSDVWALGDIEPQAGGNLRFNGTFSTAANKNIEVTARLQGESEDVSRAFILTAVQDSPLFVSQTVNVNNNIAAPGQTITYTLTVENRGRETYSNLILSTDLTGNAYDLPSLRTQGGTLTNRTVTWSTGGVNELRHLPPNAKVTVSFNVPILNPPTRFDEQNITVGSNPKVTAFELREPIPGQLVEIKIPTRLSMTQTVEHESGPYPMQIGQESRFLISWVINNTTSAVQNARVTADVPIGGNSFVSGQASAGTNLNFNAGASYLDWDIGNISPHSQRTATFVLRHTPTIIEAGTVPIFLDNITAQAFDIFVNQAAPIADVPRQARPAQGVAN